MSDYHNMHFSAKQISAAAIFAALVFVITRFIQIPMPVGYFNIGNCIILISCVLLPSPCGILAGCIGSALADLTSYPVYTVPTLIIKSVMPLLFYLLCKKPAHKTYKRQMIAAALATLIPLAGYTLTGILICGNLETGLTQVPGLLIEYGVNLVLFGILLPQIKRHKIEQQMDE